MAGFPGWSSCVHSKSAWALSGGSGKRSGQASWRGPWLRLPCRLLVHLKPPWVCVLDRGGCVAPQGEEQETPVWKPRARSRQPCPRWPRVGGAPRSAVETCAGRCAHGDSGREGHTLLCAVALGSVESLCVPHCGGPCHVWGVGPLSAGRPPPQRSPMSLSCCGDSLWSSFPSAIVPHLVTVGLPLTSTWLCSLRWVMAIHSPGL